MTKLDRDWHAMEGGMDEYGRSRPMRHYRNIREGDKVIGRIVATNNDFEVHRAQGDGFVPLSKNSTMDGAWNFFQMVYPQMWNE